MVLHRAKGRLPRETRTLTKQLDPWFVAEFLSGLAEAPFKKNKIENYKKIWKIIIIMQWIVNMWSCNSTFHDAPQFVQTVLLIHLNQSWKSSVHHSLGVHLWTNRRPPCRWGTSPRASRRGEWMRLVGMREPAAGAVFGDRFFIFLFLFFYLNFSYLFF